MTQHNPYKFLEHVKDMDTRYLIFQEQVLTAFNPEEWYNLDVIQEGCRLEERHLRILNQVHEEYKSRWKQIRKNHEVDRLGSTSKLGFLRLASRMCILLTPAMDSSLLDDVFYLEYRFLQETTKNALQTYRNEIFTALTDFNFYQIPKSQEGSFLEVEDREFQIRVDPQTDKATLNVSGTSTIDGAKVERYVNSLIDYTSIAPTTDQILNDIFTFSSFRTPIRFMDLFKEDTLSWTDFFRRTSDPKKNLTLRDLHSSISNFGCNIDEYFQNALVTLKRYILLHNTAIKSLMDSIKAEYLTLYNRETKRKIYWQPAMPLYVDSLLFKGFITLDVSAFGVINGVKILTRESFNTDLGDSSLKLRLLVETREKFRVVRKETD